jgi:hypothetical protein
MVKVVVPPFEIASVDRSLRSKPTFRRRWLRLQHANFFAAARSSR